MKQYLADLREHDQVATVVQVVRKSVARSRKDKEYITLKIRDKSAEMTAHIWDNVAAYRDLFAENDYVFLRGRVVSYQGNLQVNVASLEPFTGAVDPRDFLPQTGENVANLQLELQAAVAEVKDKWLSRLLHRFFAKDEEFYRRFCLAPAAKAMHHAYLGGLLEHTVGVVRLAQRVGGLYPQLDQDLLVTGALLHDVGKVEELSYDLAIDYTPRGRLLGHIVIGAEMVRQQAARISGFPEHQLLLVEHLLLSHHGDYQWGSPKRPKTLEAFVLHYLDDLDAKINTITGFCRASRQEGTLWSDYNRVLERFFLVNSDLLAAAGEVPEGGEASPAAKPDDDRLPGSQPLF
ncbi:MAG: HD domain-containing protein [Deltaproteobacteria bacterium]|nr:HD domain-containing protein [Deltaproteobacteria bacterium]